MGNKSIITNAQTPQKTVPPMTPIPPTNDVHSIIADTTLGGDQVRQMLDQLSQGYHGTNINDLYQNMLAATQAPQTWQSKAGQLAGAVGSAQTDPQTVAIADPKGNGAASWLNGIASFAKGFANNVNTAYAKPSYEDLIKAAEASQTSGQKIGENTMKVADAYNKNILPIKETLDYFNRAAHSYNKSSPTPQDDANIYAAYLKTQYPQMRISGDGEIDPASVSGIANGNILISYMNQILHGKQTMTDTERGNYIQAASQNMQSMKPQYDLARQQALGLAQQMKADPSIAVPDYWSTILPIQNIKQQISDEYKQRAQDILKNPTKYTADDLVRAKQILGQ